MKSVLKVFFCFWFLDSTILLAFVYFGINDLPFLIFWFIVQVVIFYFSINELDYYD